jgi:SAM-dependent methyltransferase
LAARGMASSLRDKCMSQPSRKSALDQAEDSPSVATPEMYEALESGGVADNYYAWLTDTFVPYLRGAVIEHGAGSGTLSATLLDAGVTPLILNEPNEKLAATLTRRFEARNDVTIFQGTLDDYLTREGPGSVDAIVSANVLEHIKDDEGCLATMRKLIRPGGHLVVYVPARPELYGTFDRLIGHHRRYRRPELRRKLISAGFEIEILQYRNLVATLAWLWNVRILDKTQIREANVKFYDQYIFPVIRWVEDRIAPPYGLNLLAVAR